MHNLLLRFTGKANKVFVNLKFRNTLTLDHSLEFNEKNRIPGLLIFYENAVTLADTMAAMKMANTANTDCGQSYYK